MSKAVRLTNLDSTMPIGESHSLCRSIVVTGAGKAFCAGIDVKSVAKRDAAAGSAATDTYVAGYEN